MNAIDVKNNQDLITFLLELTKTLEKRGDQQSANIITNASGLANGSPSEFLFEVLQALGEIKNNNSNSMTTGDLHAINLAVKKIYSAFLAVGDIMNPPQ